MSLNLTFGKKLTASFLSCFVLGSVLGYVAITSIKSLARSIESITVRDARKLKLIGDYQTNVSELRVEQRGVVIAGATHVQTEVDAAHRRFDTEVVHMQQIAEELRPLLVTENGKRLLAETSRAMREWQPLERRIYEASRAGDIELATRLLAESRNIADGMTRDAASLTEAMQALLKTTTDESNAAATRAEVIAYVALAIFLLIGILGIAIVSKSTRQLRRITGQLHESAEQVSSAADQVSSSSQSLAHGASEQAASLEETSASTEEINSLTKRNAENSKNAAGLAGEVDRRVAQSNAALEQLVNSMQGISASSEKISRIMKVINEIAFQTNLLALNAAVEAARAGDAGMGFAVVADEVRNLAQRCSQAAKDTEALIEESLVSSADGKTRVAEVATTIRAITESMVETKTLVDEVQLGSQEQARGIEQVAKTISQMESVTQQTAASAEESAAAGEELSAQANTLREVVDQLGALVGDHREGSVRSALAISQERR
jgi:methyl-accepting chemotaxis protein